MVMELSTTKMDICMRVLLRMEYLMVTIAMKGWLMAAPFLGLSHRGRKMDLV